MVAQARKVSLAEFLALPDDGHLHEFVRGVIRAMPPPKGEHGRVEAELLGELRSYLIERARALGWTPAQGLRARDRLVGFVAGGEFGLRFALPDDPHQIRGADGAYVPAEQYARVTWDRRDYFPAVPQLVIEVVSGSEAAADVAEKVQDYLAGGARRVWCLYPSRQAVHIHDADGPTHVVRGDDLLTDEQLLPGFAVPLGAILPPEDGE